MTTSLVTHCLQKLAWSRVVTANHASWIFGVLTKMIEVEVGGRGPTAHFYRGLLRPTSLLSLTNTPFPSPSGRTDGNTAPPGRRELGTLSDM